MTRLLFALAMTALAAAAAAQTPHTHDHGFGGAEHWAQGVRRPGARRLAEAARGDPGAEARARRRRGGHRRRHWLLRGPPRAHDAAGPRLRRRHRARHGQVPRRARAEVRREEPRAGAGRAGRSEAAREGRPRADGRRLSPHRPARRVLPEARGLPEAGRRDRDRRLHEGVAGRSAAGVAHCRERSEGRDEGAPATSSRRSTRSCRTSTSWCSSRAERRRRPARCALAARRRAPRSRCAGCLLHSAMRRSSSSGGTSSTWVASIQR